MNKFYATVVYMQGDTDKFRYKEAMDARRSFAAVCNDSEVAYAQWGEEGNNTPENTYVKVD